MKVKLYGEGRRRLLGSENYMADQFQGVVAQRV